MGVKIGDFGLEIGDWKLGIRIEDWDWQLGFWMGDWDWGWGMGIGDWKLTDHPRHLFFDTPRPPGAFKFIVRYLSIMK